MTNSGPAQACIFCQMAAGSLKSLVVYKDDLVTAIMDINPVTTGHVFLIPNKHYETIDKLPENVLGRAFVVSKHISSAMEDVLDAKATQIFHASGTSAGQRAPHFMLHIIPVYNDNDRLFDLPRHKVALEEFGVLISRLRNMIHILMGKAPPDPEADRNMTNGKSGDLTSGSKAESDSSLEDKSQNNQTVTKEKKADLDKISKLFD